MASLWAGLAKCTCRALRRHGGRCAVHAGASPSAQPSRAEATARVLPGLRASQLGPGTAASGRSLVTLDHLNVPLGLGDHG